MCLSWGWRGWVGSRRQAPISQPGASLLLRRAAAACAVSHQQPLRASGFGPAFTTAFPGCSCLHSQYADVFARSWLLNTPSVFKGKIYAENTQVIQRARSSLSIFFFLLIIHLVIVETMKLFSSFRHETWPQIPPLAIRRPGLSGVSMKHSSWLQTARSLKSLSKVTREQAEHAFLRSLQERMCLCWKNTLNTLKMPAALTLHLLQGG